MRTLGFSAALIAILCVSACAARPAASTADSTGVSTTVAISDPKASASPDIAAASTSASTRPATASAVVAANKTAAAPRSVGTQATATHAIWHPQAGLTWQWQLSGTIDTSVNVQVYDIDGDTAASVVAKLHAAGRKVICYVDTGSYEDYRSDASKFPASVLGKTNGWPGERWLDIRKVSILKPIMAARFAACGKKGFDGIEADNVDGYENDTGFDLTASEQLAYNRMLAGLAHADGLAIGLKNDVDQVGQLQPSFEFSVDEQCFEYTECDQLKPFITADKPVFEVEYNLKTTAFCTKATALGSARAPTAVTRCAVCRCTAVTNRSAIQPVPRIPQSSGGAPAGSGTVLSGRVVTLSPPRRPRTGRCRPSRR